jgi:Na+-translocating ferredoxin:NAD+ oxidoreductase RnfD subunit
LKNVTASSTPCYEFVLTKVQAALIAAVVSAAFSWPAIDSSPWTVKATFYAALILSLVAVSVGSQQSIALSRLGGHPAGLENLKNKLRRGKGTVTRSQLYIWQLPVMITNISILLFLIGMLIIIWSKATQYAVWDDELKVSTTRK